MRILLLLFAAIGIVGHTEALQCYNKQHRGGEVTKEECPAVRNKYCYMENNYGEDYRGCGKCSDVHKKNFNCQDCTENLCNGGDVGKSPFPKCYVQVEGADFKHEESQCYGYHDKSCKMQNCDGKIMRGCGECSTWDKGCNCQNCTEDLCNGGEVKNLAIKCYAQQIITTGNHYDGSDSEMKEKQCTRHDSNSKFCSTKTCDFNEDGVTEYWVRGCGECPEAKNRFCECHQCDTELCNKENNANANNLVGIGMFAILFVSLMFGNAVMEMTF